MGWEGAVVRGRAEGTVAPRVGWPLSTHPPAFCHVACHQPSSSVEQWAFSLSQPALRIGAGLSSQLPRCCHVGWRGLRTEDSQSPDGGASKPSPSFLTGPTCPLAFSVERLPTVLPPWPELLESLKLGARNPRAF